MIEGKPHKNALRWSENPGTGHLPLKCAPHYKVRVKYRGGPGFDPENYLPSGLPAVEYWWRHSDPVDEADIVAWTRDGVQ